MSRYVVILVAIALAILGAFWLIQLILLGHPQSVPLRGWPPYPVSSCTYYPDWSDAPFTCVR